MHMARKTGATDPPAAFPSALRPRSQAGRDAGTPPRGTGAARKGTACTDGKPPTPAPQEQRCGLGRNPNYSTGQVGTDHSGPTSQSTGYSTAARWLPTVSRGEFTATLSNLFQCPVTLTVNSSRLFRRNASSGGIPAAGRRGPRGPGDCRGPGQSPAGSRRAEQSRAPRTRLRSRAACSRWKSRRARAPGRCLSAHRLMALPERAGRGERRAPYGGHRGTNPGGGPAPAAPSGTRGGRAPALPRRGFLFGGTEPPPEPWQRQPVCSLRALARAPHQAVRSR